MRTVLLILFASTCALVLTALLGGRSGLPPVVARDGPAPPVSASILSMRPAFAPLPLPKLARGTPGELPQAAPPARRPGGADPDALVLASLSLPLTERTLSQSERGEPVTPELQDAINRIEPIHDPTRLDGPFVPALFRIWSGTASLTDIFGEHWHLASDDANVNAKVSSFGLVWRRTAALPCDAVSKNRAHQVGETALSALNALDCSRLQQRQARRFDDAAPIPIVAAPVALPVFAAPPPGARMSSGDFWAAQQARVSATRALLQRKWQAARTEPNDLGLR